MDVAPEFWLPHATHPFRGEVAVVQLLHLPCEPGGNMNSISDVADRNFLFDSPGPDMGPHAPGDFPM